MVVHARSREHTILVQTIDHNRLMRPLPGSLGVEQTYTSPSGCLLAKLADKYTRIRTANRTTLCVYTFFDQSKTIGNVKKQQSQCLVASNEQS